jgi:hypothetical protein
MKCYKLVMIKKILIYVMHHTLIDQSVYIIR